MKRMFGALLLALAGSLSFAETAVVPDVQVATFENVSGSVGIARKNATLAAVAGMPLFVSDRITSGTNASAGIVFRDGTLFTVGPSSDVDIRDFAFEPQQAKFNFFVHLARGVAIYSSGMIGKLAPQAVKVSTPTATVGIRGTRFLITADPSLP